ncbi:hypothetical protein B5M09_003465 [Aphanomyces astaci]|uniref:Uncharacterized protein n=1 Tax=Aphanomyces astaci TaxID=112090 RepID=A0A425DC90_APHAT|nr:hypothetical protein B5M09_003465 [Aphanomyces astaci]
MCPTTAPKPNPLVARHNRFTNRNTADMTAHTAIQPKPHLFPIRHWLPSPNDTAWTSRPNMTPPKPSPTPTDVHTDYSKPMCPPAAHLTDPPYNRFTGFNTTDTTPHAAIQPKPHLFPTRHWLPPPNDTAWTPRPNMTPPKPSPTPTDVHTDYSKPLCPPAAHLTDPPYNRFTGLNNTAMTPHAAIQPKPHLFPIRHWLPSPNDTAWTPRPNMTPPKPSPTPTDVKTDYSKPLCPTISHLTDPPYNRFTALNNTAMTPHAAIQPKPHLFPKIITQRHGMDTPAEHDIAETVADIDGCQNGLQQTAVSHHLGLARCTRASSIFHTRYPEYRPRAWHGLEARYL